MAKKFDFSTMHLQDIPKFVIALFTGKLNDPKVMTGQTGFYEINLVPDVKVEMIRMQRIRNLVIFVCIAVSVAALSVVSMLGSIKGGQDIFMASQDDRLETLSTKINSYSELPVFLTIQNQLAGIEKLEDNHKVLSRVITTFSSILPKGKDEVKVSELAVNMDTSTISFDGQANAGTEPYIDYRVLESFMKSVDMMHFDYGRYVDALGNVIPSRCIEEYDSNGNMYSENGSIYAIWHRGREGCDPTRNDWEDVENMTNLLGINATAMKDETEPISEDDDSGSTSRQTIVDNPMVDCPDGSVRKQAPTLSQCNVPEEDEDEEEEDENNPLEKKNTYSKLDNLVYSGEKYEFGSLSGYVASKSVAVTTEGNTRTGQILVADEKIYRTPQFTDWYNEKVYRTSQDGLGENLKDYIEDCDLNQDGIFDTEEKTKCATYELTDADKETTVTVTEDSVNGITTSTYVHVETNEVAGREVTTETKTMKNDYTYHPVIDTSGAISGVPHFESTCITYSGEDNTDASKVDADGNTIKSAKWTADYTCDLVPDGINVSDSSNGRDAEDKLVLRFTASITMNPDVFKYKNKHVMIIGPTGQNVTDSYLQLKDIFAAPATACDINDTECWSNTSNSGGTN